MRVKFIECFSTEREVYKTNAEYELPHEYALNLVRVGIASEVDAVLPTPEPSVAAGMEKVERTVDGKTIITPVAEKKKGKHGK